MWPTPNSITSRYSRRRGQPLLAVGSLGTDPGQFALVAGLYIDAQDRIYTTEMFHGRIQVFQYLSLPGTAREKGVGGANH